MDQQELLTPAQVAVVFGVTAASVRAWIKEGDLPAIRTPGGRGQIRIRRSDVEALVTAGTPETPVAS